jgi:ATP-dependent RNA helicase DeaD
MPEVDSDKRRYRIEVGHEHGVKPGNIVGAIANEAGLDGEHIGHIEIDQEFSLVDLPAGMPRDIFMDLKKVRVCGRPMKITMLGEHEKPPAKNRKHPKTNPKAKPKAKAKAKKRLRS